MIPTSMHVVNPSATKVIPAVYTILTCTYSLPIMYVQYYYTMYVQSKNHLRTVHLPYTYSTW